MTIREILDVILAESAQFRATPVFYSGNELGDATNNDYYYVGQLFAGGASLSAVTPENAATYPGDGLAVFRYCSVSESGTSFSFAGYRIHCPGRRPPIEPEPVVPHVGSITQLYAQRVDGTMGDSNQLTLQTLWTNGNPSLNYETIEVYIVLGQLYDPATTISRANARGMTLGREFTNPASLSNEWFNYERSIRL